MQDRPPQGRVENFTGAFLVSLGVLLFMAFLTIAALFGWLWVVISAAGIDFTVTKLGGRKA